MREIKPTKYFVPAILLIRMAHIKFALILFLPPLEVIKKEPDNEWLKDCWIWLYKGAWEEWDITEIEMAVPMSPEQVRKKRYGIFIHQSQKDSVPFQGSDEREFWQRAEERNANTADLYARLGLTKYAAMEAFVRLKDLIRFKKNLIDATFNPAYTLPFEMKKILAFFLLISHMNTSMFLPQVPEDDVYDTNGNQLDDINSIVEYVMVKIGLDHTADDEDNDSGQNLHVVTGFSIYI